MGNAMLRIVLCASGNFAVPSLKAISDSSHRLMALITQPARRAGRGRKLKSTPAACTAVELGIAVTECSDVNDRTSAELLQSLKPDVICVVDFGQFISSEVCSLAGLGAFNLHGSLLPELRGAAPVNWAIIRGYEHTGVTTFSIVDQMDAGKIYLQAQTEIRPGETAVELSDRLARIGAETVCKTLDMLAEGNARTTRQDESKVTFAPRLGKLNGAIDFSRDARDVVNLIHGTWPWPGGQALLRRKNLDDVKVTIARAKVADEDSQLEPGYIDEDMFVAAGSGRLEIVEIKPAGKRLMTWRDFVNGYRLKAFDYMTV